MDSLRLVEATAHDLDRIMELERQGFAAGHQELRSAYAQRIAAFPQGSLMAWREANCVGCVFSEIWRATPLPDAAHFTLGHDIRDHYATRLRSRYAATAGRDSRANFRSICQGIG